MATRHFTLCCLPPKAQVVEFVLGSWNLFSVQGVSHGICNAVMKIAVSSNLRRMKWLPLDFCSLPKAAARRKQQEEESRG